MPSLKSSIGNKEHISLDDVCFLISIISSGKDALNQPIVTESLRQVFCSKLSLNRAEFLAAGQLNHKPQMTIVVDSDEYDGEKKLEYDRVTYTIYRSFPRSDGFTELHCEVRASG